MKIETINVILKRCTAAILLSSLLFLFLPYRLDMSPIDVLNAGGDISIILINFFLPVLFSLIAAFLVWRKFGVIKCLFASALNAINFFYAYYDYVFDSWIKPNIGLIMNTVIAALGIVLPIIIIVINIIIKKSKPHEGSTKNVEN